jgi:hypothetical protein
LESRHHAYRRASAAGTTASSLSMLRIALWSHSRIGVMAPPLREALPEEEGPRRCP